MAAAACPPGCARLPDVRPPGAGLVAEVANAQPSQGGLDPVVDARGFPHQAFALPGSAVWRPLRQSSARAPCCDGLVRHAATREPPLQQLGVEPSGFARRCSRDTATLEGWITCASTPRAASQGTAPSQKPSRPASTKATAIRVILPPALSASVAPAMQHGKQPFWARLELTRLAFNAGKHTANQPARLARLRRRQRSCYCGRGRRGTCSSRSAGASRHSIG